MIDIWHLLYSLNRCISVCVRVRASVRVCVSKTVYKKHVHAESNLVFLECRYLSI